MFDHLELTAVMTSIFGTEETNRRVLRSDMSDKRKFKILVMAFRRSCCSNQKGAGSVINGIAPEDIMHHHGSLLSYFLILIKFICVLNYRILGFPKMIVLSVDSQPWHS